MGLLGVLKKVGKELKDVEGWIGDGLKIADPILSVVDPPLGMILSAVEQSLNNLPAGQVDKDVLKSLVTAAASSLGTKCPCCGCPLITKKEAT